METQKNTPNTDEMPLSPEEIKAIGEIELGPAKHEVFLNKHYKKLIVCGIAFMVAASAAIGYYSYRVEQQEIAGALVVDAARSARVEGAVEPAQYDAKAISRISTEFAETNAADTARLMEALALTSDTARVQTGVSQLESLAATAQSELLRARALSALAAHYMAEEQNDKSAAYWKQVISLPVNPYSAIAYISLGDLAQLAGDKEAARNFYTQVGSVCPNSPLVSENVAALRLALLDVEAPTPVDPPAEKTPAEAPQPAAPTPFDTASPFGTPQPAAPASDSESFGGMSTLPGGIN